LHLVGDLFEMSGNLHLFQFLPIIVCTLTTKVYRFFVFSQTLLLKVRIGVQQLCSSNWFLGSGIIFSLKMVHMCRNML